jgi:hypothetical protein
MGKLSGNDWDDLIESANELRAVKFTQSDIDAAVAAEREACKKICAANADAAEECGGTEDDGAIMAHMIWRLISARSNAELTGDEAGRPKASG